MSLNVRYSYVGMILQRILKAVNVQKGIVNFLKLTVCGQNYKGRQKFCGAAEKYGYSILSVQLE